MIETELYSLVAVSLPVSFYSFLPPRLQTVENISNLSPGGLCPPVQVGLAVVVGSGSYPHLAHQGQHRLSSNTNVAQGGQLTAGPSLVTNVKHKVTKTQNK